MCMHADALWRSLTQHWSLLETLDAVFPTCHMVWHWFHFFMSAFESRGSRTPPRSLWASFTTSLGIIMRFIFPELQSLKCLTAVLFGQLQSGISVTQHIASKCMCQRERSDKGDKSGSANNKKCTCVALGRWCCCFSGRKTKSLADKTVLFRVENLPLPSQQSIRSNATASIMLQASEVWRKESEVFDVKKPTGNVFFWLKNHNSYGMFSPNKLPQDFWFFFFLGEEEEKKDSRIEERDSPGVLTVFLCLSLQVQYRRHFLFFQHQTPQERCCSPWWWQWWWRTCVTELE